MPTQLEKTAAFLKKLAAEGSVWDKSLFGGADAPFAQPAPGVTQQELMEVANAGLRGPGAPNAAVATAIMEQLNKAQTAAAGKGVPQAELDRINTSYGKDGAPLVAPKEAPGFGSNLMSALGRGHAGTVAATGAAALLAGVLTYNMLKKRSKGKITKMPMRKAAAAGQQMPLTRAADRTQKIREVAKGGARKAGLTGLLAGLVGGGGAGYALGGDSGPTLGGDSGPTLDASGGKTVAGKNLGILTGSGLGTAAAGVGIAGLGALGLYLLYKKIRGE